MQLINHRVQTLHMLGCAHATVAMHAPKGKYRVHAMLVSVSAIATVGICSWIRINTSNMPISIGIIIPSQQHSPEVIHLLCTRPIASYPRDSRGSLPGAGARRANTKEVVVVDSLTDSDSEKGDQPQDDCEKSTEVGLYQSVWMLPRKLVGL